MHRLLLLALAALIAADEFHYTNFKLMRINPDTEEDLGYLKELYRDSAPYELDFWQPPTHVGAVVDVTVAPSDAPSFVSELESRGITFIVAVDDLSKAIENEKSQDHSGHHHHPSEFAYDQYHGVDEIHEEMKRLKKSYPSMITLIDIGQSHQNRTLLVMKISGPRNPLGSKLSMWIDGGIHAREWISPATAMYMAHELITGYEKDADVQRLLDHIDFYVLPVLNPDGYEYSRTKDRMWRKNRSPSKCRRTRFSTICCAGVDLNRNFDWFFAATGSSSDPCHDTYHGESAFSEPETAAVRDFLEQNPPEAFITLHSYSQMWLIPYGHRKLAYPQDYHTGLRPLALRATKALYDVYGTKYQVGTGADMMYEASGGSHDWAKGKLKVPYSYLIELRPKNTMLGHGFLLPEREIMPTGAETFEAIKVVADELVAQFVTPLVEEKEEKKTTKPPMRRGYSIVLTTTTTETPPETSPPSTTTTPPSSTTAAFVRQGMKFVAVTATPTTSSTTEEPSTTAAIRCIDYGSYCRLWGVLQLCYREEVGRLCAATCDPRCLQTNS